MTAVGETIGGGRGARPSGAAWAARVERLSREPTKISVRNLNKTFRIYKRPSDRLVEWATLGKVSRHSSFVALDDISLDVKRGQWYGIFGPNGAGKSTLLKILTGVLMPTAGEVELQGQVTSLLELGTGFNPDLTGRENVFLSARLLGYDDRFVAERYDRIIEFAGQRQFENLPIKYYSSGMTVRLAFAIFASLDPDVFIIDEALSVGDYAFSRKCFERLDEMRTKGCTVVFVTHDIGVIRKYCDEAMYIDKGRCIYKGDPLAATDLYTETQTRIPPSWEVGGGGVHTTARQIAAWREALPGDSRGIFVESTFDLPGASDPARPGDGGMRIRAATITNDRDEPCGAFGFGETAHIHLLVESREDAPPVNGTIQLVNPHGVPLWGTHFTLLFDGRGYQLPAGRWAHVVWELGVDLGEGRYTIDLGLGACQAARRVYDRLTGALKLDVLPATPGALDFVGHFRLPVRATVREF
ncbi:MAG: ABC transporter ATP-binding protein [Phycisphaeraceae bacterium]|nr:MAG: ABC transporter ATP-binding protein [Phycisphaeraceae bacterium]